MHLPGSLGFSTNVAKKEATAPIPFTECRVILLLTKPRARKLQLWGYPCHTVRRRDFIHSFVQAAFGSGEIALGLGFLG